MVDKIEALAHYLDCADCDANHFSLGHQEYLVLCESANPAIMAMVGNQLEELIEGAMSADGRGHFLSSYDGNEYEQDGYYIYRIN